MCQSVPPSFATLPSVNRISEIGLKRRGGGQIESQAKNIFRKLFAGFRVDTLNLIYQAKIMNLIAAALIVLGLLLFVFGGLWFLVAAFRESIWWGLACLLIPIVQLFFLIVHWPEAKKPFLLQLAAFAVFIVGFIIAPQTLHR